MSLDDVNQGRKQQATDKQQENSRRERVALSFDGGHHIVKGAVVARELEDPQQAEHSQDTQICARQNQLQIKRHRADEVDDPVEAKQILFAPLPF